MRCCPPQSRRKCPSSPYQSLFARAHVWQCSVWWYRGTLQSALLGYITEPQPSPPLESPSHPWDSTFWRWSSRGCGRNTPGITRVKPAHPPPPPHTPPHSEFTVNHLSATHPDTKTFFQCHPPSSPLTSVLSCRE